jgi:outer membrane protein insertion porin family
MRRLRAVAVVLPLAVAPASTAASEPRQAPATAPAPDWQRFEGRRISAIAFSGHRVTRDHVIARELESKAGEPLRAATLEADLTRLENLGIFASTRVVAEADGDDGVFLTLRFHEMPPVLPFPSFVYTEENGFSYGLALSALNLTGRAISLSARAYFGGTDQRWVKLSHPWIAGDHVSADFFGGRRERLDTMNAFNEDSWEFTPGVGRWLGRNGRVRAFLSLFTMESDVPGKTLDVDDRDAFLRLGASFGHDTRDSWRAPHKGWKNEVELLATWGSGSFVTLNLDLRRYVPTWASQELLLSGLLTLQSGTVGEDVPGYFTYYLGGANSIRGYELETAGPTLNGKNQLLTTAEYNIELMKIARRDFWKWSYSVGLELALFADAGIAWSESHDFAFQRFRGGLGAGIRLLVPGTEQVRFDLGWSPSEGAHFHFASGTKPVAQRQRLR